MVNFETVIQNAKSWRGETHQVLGSAIYEVSDVYTLVLASLFRNHEASC